MKYTILTFFASLLCLHLLGQEDRAYQDFDHSKSIASVVLSTGDPSLTSFPAIPLKGAQVLRVNFDYLNTDQANLTYTVEHMDRNWIPSNLRFMDYIQGYERNPIRDFKFSNTTGEDYMSYSFTLPNRDLSFRLSGNYVLKVFEGDELMFSRRFFVYEDLIKADIRYERAVNLLEDQSFDVELDFSSHRVRNPKTDIFMSVYQNGRWDNALQALQPLYFFGNKFSFDRNRGVVFKAGKEFRMADLRSIDQRGQNVRSVSFFKDGIEVELFPDVMRFKENVILNEEDLNGNFWLTGGGVGRSNFSSEYVDVLFSLKDEPIFPDKQIYLVGKFSNWNCTDKYLMEYDDERKDFFLYATLRQGVYDYAYAVISPDGGCTQIPIDGSLNGTGNDYAFVVYNTSFTPFVYDRIVYLDQRTVQP